ncbi:hypothetical protein ABFS82_14G227800 [Erythranthe guttata]|uniref:uncharacterized protein LOC105958683 n=1 Tax=Erythranthe guttata TaxID=4155 RepID=UPI00064DBE18|nr:PREDICTED: uncharacterized protein LOC105958683 [Erythranthe guttata]|eukprot:XP_012838147.1 PREDICTED: uncharacterized protein LOC105958683 [Erythranthe guttata]
MSAQSALDSSAETSSSLKDSRFDAVLDTADSGGGGIWSRMGEATGECAAVCCCCPCTVMHLFILAVFRLPAALWRRKKKARRRRLLRKKMKCPPLEKANQQKLEDGGDCRGKNDAVEWDSEMWELFYGGGFWRSASQRDKEKMIIEIKGIITPTSLR